MEGNMPDSRYGLSWFSKNLIEILPAAVYVCNLDGTIASFNKRAAELWGRTPLLGQTDVKFCGSHRLYRLDGTFLPHAETPMEWVLRTGETAHDLEVIIERTDGSRITVLVNIAPLFNDLGTQIGAVNCFQDLTAQKQGEADRTKLADDLRQAQKMEAVGQLTGGLAHDFNNLLTGISGSLELAQSRLRQGRIEELERYHNAAQAAASRAAALTHRLLAFSRRQPLEAATIDINRLVTGLEDLVNRTVGPEIAVVTVGKNGLWNALVDQNQLENALLNLCINARDAMPHGGKLIVETSNREIDAHASGRIDMPVGQYVALTVSDNGVGMPPEVAAHAFDPFYTTKPIGAGTGLGLSMIYGFARQSGGQVRIHSVLGEGTSVTLYLPRQHGPEDSDAPQPIFTAPAHAATGTSVLVVDDEETVRMLIAEVLEEEGYVIITAHNAAAGLRILQSGARIDLLITDVGLPGGMNGRQLAEAARTFRCDLKILFITGYAENAMIARNHLAPGMHVMTKPFSIDLLTRQVSALIAAEYDPERITV
jgi:PAS domain S-box-containing protein